MRRNIILTLFCALLLILSLQGCKNEVKETTTVTAKNGLTLRSGPDINAKKITVIPWKEKVGILSYSKKISVITRKTAPWVKVRYKKKEGWVFGAFLANYVPQELDDRSRLGKFALSPFRKDLYDNPIGPTVKEAILKNMPGTPKIETKEEKNIHDDSVTDKKYTLTYPGTTFSIYHATKLKKQIMQGIVITAGSAPLKYGIKTGMAPPEITRLLGPPAEQKKNSLYFKTSDALPVEVIFNFKGDRLREIILAYPVE